MKQCFYHSYVRFWILDGLHKRNSDINCTRLCNGYFIVIIFCLFINIKIIVTGGRQPTIITQSWTKIGYNCSSSKQFRISFL